MVAVMRSIGFACLLALAACSRSDEKAAPAPGQPAARPATDPVHARQLISQGALVLDVRTPDEFADGHVPSATNIAVQEVGARRAEIDQMVGGDRSRPVVVYCASGGRAAKAKAQLEAAGYTHVVNGGGYDDLR